MKLYEIVAEIQAIVDASEECGLTPEMEARLDALDLSLEAKADNIAALYQQSRAEQDIYDTEAARLKTLAARAGKKAQDWRAYLHRELARLGAKKVKGRRFTVTVCDNSQPGVAVEDASALPDALKTVVTTITPNRSAILEAWKANQQLPLGVTITTGTHLRIS